MSTFNIIQVLRNEKEKLSEAILTVEKRLRKAPGGNVRIVKHGKGYQYYYREKSSDKNGVYIPASEKRKALELIQKQYDLQVQTAAAEQIAVIDRFLKKYDPEILKTIYSSLPEGKRVNISPVEISDAEHVQKWLSAEYNHKDISEDAPEHYTSKGERVRSKSEVMIADALEKAGIPYRYECQLNFGHISVYPDFTILRARDRAVLYWEHLGMMDDPDYSQKALRKIRQYEAYGILPGNSLIITMETSDVPINLSVINQMIKAYCY